MLEEKNDNLSLQENKTDGKTANELHETIPSESLVAEIEISDQSDRLCCMGTFV